MRILIVDPEYLVAMEAERILDGALDCDIQIAMPRSYPAVLDSETFDVVVIDTGLVTSAEAGRRLRESGAAVVFVTLSQRAMAGIDGWPDTVVVAKPFDDTLLIEAVRNAAPDLSGVSVRQI